MIWIAKKTFSRTSIMSSKIAGSKGKVVGLVEGTIYYSVQMSWTIVIMSVELVVCDLFSYNCTIHMKYAERKKNHINYMACMQFRGFQWISTHFSNVLFLFVPKVCLLNFFLFCFWLLRFRSFNSFQICLHVITIALSWMSLNANAHAAIPD